MRLRSKYLYFNLTSSPYSMSELTGKGKMSDFDNISNAFITISISPVLRDVLIVSEDLFKTLPIIFITAS